MKRDDLQRLLASIQGGATSVEEGLRALAGLPEIDLGHTRLDTQRELRCGHAEVVYGAGKSPAELLEIARNLLEHHERLLVTRLTDAGAQALREAFPRGRFHERARAFTLAPESDGEGLVVVLSAGTSDGAVADEAAVTARFMGAKVEEIRDVGVAGLHRLLAHLERMRAARALIVVAGMEGALPSVVGGLVDRPVIAVPTSVGYGASFGGIAALLGMLNSCAAGVTVVNIDNGFGAGCAAARINHLAEAR